MQDAHGRPPRRRRSATPDFAALAAAVGLPYARIDVAAGAPARITAAVASDRPRLVEVDLAALGPMPAPFTPPVEVPSTARKGGDPR